MMIIIITIIPHHDVEMNQENCVLRLYLFIVDPSSAYYVNGYDAQMIIDCNVN